MRLRTFTAPDIPAAMSMVRDALGDDAIILATDAKAGRGYVTVTAAIEDEYNASADSDYNSNVRTAHKTTPQLTANKRSAYENEEKTKTAIVNRQVIDDIRFELQNILRFHNIPEILIAKMLQKVTHADFAEIIERKTSQEGLIRLALEKLLSRNFVFEPLRVPARYMRIMLIGSSGVGKTLTVAKLATKLSMDKQPVSVITTDVTRAGGVEQLQAFTSILNIKLQVVENHEELKQIYLSIPPERHVLIDTAGCSPYDNKAFEELKDISGIENIEPVFVIAAGGDSLEAIDMLEVFTELKIRRLLVTRADATKRFGGVVSATMTHGLSFCNISRSAGIMDSVQPLEPVLLAQMLLKHKY